VDRHVAGIDLVSPEEAVRLGARIEVVNLRLPWIAELANVSPMCPLKSVIVLGSLVAGSGLPKGGYPGS
jgi:hypothetical protein